MARTGLQAGNPGATRFQQMAGGDHSIKTDVVRIAIASTGSLDLAHAGPRIAEAMVRRSFTIYLLIGRSTCESAKAG